MPGSRVTVEQKTKPIILIIQQNVNFIEVVVSIIRLHHRTIEGQGKLTPCEIGQIWFGLIMRWDSDIAIGDIQDPHTAITEKDAISLSDVDDIEIPVLTIQHSIKFGIIVNIIEFATSDDLCFLLVIHYLSIYDEKSSACCLRECGDEQQGKHK